jgi:hypothetical protein
MLVLVASTFGRLGPVTDCPGHHLFSGYQKSGYQRGHSDDLLLEVVLQHAGPGIMDCSGSCDPAV